MDDPLPQIFDSEVADVQTSEFFSDGPVGDGLLLEAAGVSTDFILLEDGSSFILQES